MQLILFDLDGTLTQTYYSDDNSYMRALSEQLPLEPDYAYWKDCPDLTDSAVMHHIYRKVALRDPHLEEVQQMQSTFLNLLNQKKVEHPHFFHEIPGAKKVLKQLQEEHVVGVATGGWRAVAEFKLGNIGVNTQDLHLIGSDDHFSKTEFVSALMEDLHQQYSSFDRITYIGDSLYDMRMAETLGLEFIGVDYKGANYLQEHGVERIVRDYETDTLEQFLLS